MQLRGRWEYIINLKLASRLFISTPDVETLPMELVLGMAEREAEEVSIRWTPIDEFLLSNGE